MKLTQKLLVLLITVMMILPGSFAQAFAAEEAVDGGSVVMSESADSVETADTEEIKEEAKDEVKDEHTTSPDTEAAGEVGSSSDRTKATPENKEDKAAAEAGKTETVVEAKGKTFRMEAAYDIAADIPAEGVRLYAKELEDDDPDAVTFDIKIVSEADKNVVYQPAEGHNVALTVVVLDKKADTDEDTASVLHVCEDGTKEILTADLEVTDEGYVYSFETESFSTFTFHRNGNSYERFITTVKTGRFGGSQTELFGSAEISNNDNTGWLSFEEVIYKWKPAYSNAGSDGRYSVLKANDSGSGNRHQALCAAGFFEGYVGLARSHLALGRFAVDIDTSGIGNGNVNGSGTSYDLQIELNDNSLPVRITADGTTTDKVFVPLSNETSFTPESIVEELGYNTDGMMVSGKINNVPSDSVSRAQLTVNDIPTNTGTGSAHTGWWTRLLAGETFDDFGPGRAVIALNTVNYTATNVSYPAAYKWTYNNGSTENVIGDTPYEIKIIPAVAQVSNDGGATWKKFACLITGDYDGETLEGAFDYANSLTEDVIVEMLYDTHERYTLNSGFNFNNTGIDSLTINGTSNKSTIVKDQTTASMITTSGINTVNINGIVFNGNGPMTVTGNGGAVKTDADSLNVSGCIFNNCEAGKTGSTPGQGGGISHENPAGEVSIVNCEFNQCKANGKDDSAAGGGGFFTNAQSLTVTGSSFTDCETASRQGAGFFHRRVNGDPVSQTTVKDCTFNNCVSVWSGGGMESDAWNVTVEECQFTDCKATTSDNKAKGGAINVWANGHDKSPENTSFSVKKCKFKNCSSTDNGGAIRTTALTSVIEESSFEGCSSSKNGGAVAATNDNKNSSLTISDCEFSDCHADEGNGGACFTNAKKMMIGETSAGETVINECSAKNGGAIQSGPLTMTGGTISNCTATQRGGAINSGSTITMTGGTVTGNKTEGDSAALDASTARAGFYFSGDVVIAGNTGTEGEARDVYLGLHSDSHSDQHIQIDDPGLGPYASIGVYVPSDTAGSFDNHGKPGQLFARSTGVLATRLTNLDKLFSDRLDNGEMHGAAAVQGSGDNWKYRIMWSGETPVAPTGYNSKYIPFLLILLGGAALVILKKAADRRRESEDSTCETEE